MQNVLAVCTLQLWSKMPRVAASWSRDPLRGDGRPIRKRYSRWCCDRNRSSRSKSSRSRSRSRSGSGSRACTTIVAGCGGGRRRGGMLRRRSRSRRRRNHIGFDIIDISRSRSKSEIADSSYQQPKQEKGEFKAEGTTACSNGIPVRTKQIF